MAEALAALRLLREARWLWCDAISINQQDQVEKAHQVQMIQTIFQKASRVVAWLGPEDTDSVWVFRELARREVTRGHLNHSGEDLEKVLRLTNRPWFHRIWIRLEVFAAQELLLQTGSRTGRFPDLMDLVAYAQLFKLCDSGTVNILSKDYYGRPPSVPYGRRAEIVAKFCSRLLQTVADGLRFGASDDRDRIYGLLGLVKGASSQSLSWRDEQGRLHQPKSFPVDYGKSLSEVYQGFVKYLINLSGSLACIEVYRWNSRPPTAHAFERLDGLPSWATDWRTDILSCRTLSNIGSARQQLDARLGELVLEGRLVGTVSRISSQASDYPQSRDANLEFYCDQNLNKLLKEGRYVCRDLTMNPCSGLRRGSPKDFGIIAPQYCEQGDLLISFQGSVESFAVRRVPTPARRFMVLGMCGYWGANVAGMDLSHLSRCHCSFATGRLRPYDRSGYMLYLEKCLAPQTYGEGEGEALELSDSTFSLENMTLPPLEEYILV